MESMLDARLNRRGTLNLLATTPIALALAGATPLASQAATRSGVLAVKESELDRQTIDLLARHINTVTVTTANAVSPAKRTIDLFWSQSCPDSLRGFYSYVHPLLKTLPEDTVIGLHLVARRRVDIDVCVAIRSVNPAHYTDAVRAVLETGAQRGPFRTVESITEVLKSFPQGGEGFNHEFARNCVVAARQQLSALGFTETPAMLIDGKKAYLHDLLPKTDNGDQQEDQG